MTNRSPVETVNQLIEAINRGNLEEALALYEPQASMVVEPGKNANGPAALRQALEGFIRLRPTLKSEQHVVVQAGDLVLNCSEWTLSGTGPDGKPVQMSGLSADVLRRQPDGRWLIAVDNPWGTAILENSEVHT